MADSAVVRNRRSRKHKADDHSECIIGRCEAVTPVVTAPETDVPVVTPERLGTAGSLLWAAMTASGSLPPMQMVLLLEACRISDRLDKLDARLTGEEREWLEIQLPEDGSIAVVIVDRALAEARQQATALKQIVAEIRQAAKPAASNRPAQPAKPTEGGKGGSVSDLTSRIAARGGSSAG